jgi:hypothetical protein
MSNPVPTNTTSGSPLQPNYYGYTRSRSGVCTLDTYFGETAFGLYVGVSGDVVLENIDETLAFLPALIAGQEHGYKFNRVVTSGVVSGVTRTTTATTIVWVGGER